MKDESGGDIKAELLETKLVVCVCIGHSWLDTVIWLLTVGSEIWVITSAPDTSLLRSQTNSVLSEKGAKCVSKVTLKGAPADGVGACWTEYLSGCLQTWTGALHNRVTSIWINGSNPEVTGSGYIAVSHSLPVFLTHKKTHLQAASYSSGWQRVPQDGGMEDDLSFMCGCVVGIKDKSQGQNGGWRPLKHFIHSFYRGGKV